MSTITDVTLADLDLFANGAPWQVFEDLRRESPVHWNVEPEPNAGFWSITRYHDIVEVLRNTQTFSSQIGAVRIPATELGPSRRIEVLQRCRGSRLLDRRARPPPATPHR